MERQPPSGLSKAFFKAPVWMYRAGMGWALGNRFCRIEHTGRTSGKPYETVLEVIDHNGDEWIDIAAAWGEKSDWFRNLQADPEIRVSMGRLKSEPATAAVLDLDAAAAAYAAYTEAHPRAAAALSKSFGLPLADPEQMAATVPLVRLTLVETKRA